jgi:nucleoside-diphosphate-sugar epimerase
MRKKYLVTGGTGFLGSALVKGLLRQGHSVRVLDNNLRGTPRRLADVLDQIEMVEADIRDAQAVMKACKGVDAIAHLAYLNGTEYFYSHPDLVLDIGVKGMVNILDGAIAAGVRDFILASSSETYQTPPIVPTPEDVPLVVPDVLNPRYSYGGGKLICELMAVNYGRKYFDRMVIFRPHNVFGPDMGWEHVVPQFSLRLADLVQRHTDGGAIPFPIQGSGEETRSFVYIDDFTDGLLLMMEHGEHLGIYHIGTEDELSIRQMAELLAREGFGREITIVPGELRPGGTPRRCPDITKLRGLGYNPSVSLAEGLRRSAQWYANNAHLQPQEKMKG